MTTGTAGVLAETIARQALAQMGPALVAVVVIRPRGEAQGKPGERQTMQIDAGTSLLYTESQAPLLMGMAMAIESLEQSTSDQMKRAGLAVESFRALSSSRTRVGGSDE